MSIPVQQMDERGLRNFREFLEIYNKISEICFNHCAVGLNRRGLSEEEGDCCDRCTLKNYNLNHRVLGAFMVEQPRITEQKVAAAQKEAEEAMKKMQAEGKDVEGIRQLTPEETATRIMDGMQSSVPNQQS